MVWGALLGVGAGTGVATATATGTTMAGGAAMAGAAGGGGLMQMLSGLTNKGKKKKQAPGANLSGEGFGGYRFGM